MKFFNSASTFRTWLAKHHRTKRELLVGFHKKHTGTSSVSYTEALDVALCYFWIDGVRRRVDDDHYTSDSPRDSHVPNGAPSTSRRPTHSSKPA